MGDMKFAVPLKLNLVAEWSKKTPFLVVLLFYFSYELVFSLGSVFQMSLYIASNAQILSTF